MDINKENVFERIFDGFQQKFIESFKALGEEKILVRILENQKASKEEFRTYFNCAWEFLEKRKIAEQQAKVEELQKRVDAQTKHVEMALLAVKDIYKSAKDEFHNWDVFNEKEPKLCEHLQNLSVAAGELEQALKGGEGYEKN